MIDTRIEVKINAIVPIIPFLILSDLAALCEGFGIIQSTDYIIVEYESGIGGLQNFGAKGTKMKIGSSFGAFLVK